MSASVCPHIKDHVKKVKPRTKGCEECLKIGDRWVHLRMCLECGKVGCCDSSKNRHATAHFHQEGHPIMRSIEPGEDWRWCYIDEIELDLSDLFQFSVGLWHISFVFHENERNTGHDQRGAQKHPRRYHFSGEEVAQGYRRRPG